MFNPDDHLIPEAPRSRRLADGPVIAATRDSVMQLLRKKNAPTALFRLAGVAVSASQDAADRLSKVGELTEAELATRADVAQEFAMQASGIGAAELTSRQEARPPLPEAYHDTAELVKMAEEYQPGPRKILLPEEPHEPS
jgi:hypothetical protein